MMEENHDAREEVTYEPRWLLISGCFFFFFFFFFLFNQLYIFDLYFSVCESIEECLPSMGVTIGFFQNHFISRMI